MLERDPDFHPETAGPGHLERRAFVRLPSALTAHCRPTARRRHDVSWPATVYHISRGGLGLVLRHCFRPGTRLIVELHARGGTLLRTVEVRVVHARAVVTAGNRCWLLGCAFDVPLGDEEMRALV